MADECLRAETAIYYLSKSEIDWVTALCDKMEDMDASARCLECYLQEKSLPRRGLRIPLRSSEGMAWLEESCLLAEAERLRLYDPSTKKKRETDLDLDYIFAEPTAE